MALAVASAKRSPAFPNVPTAAESGVPNYEVSTWYAMWVPKGTPKEIVDRLYAETEKALNTPEIKQVWLNNGSDTPTFTQEQFAQFLHGEIRRWAQVVQQSGAAANVASAATGVIFRRWSRPHSIICARRSASALKATLTTSRD